jgi:hypothetical protein
LAGAGEDWSGCGALDCGRIHGALSVLERFPRLQIVRRTAGLNGDMLAAQQAVGGDLHRGIFGKLHPIVHQQMGLRLKGLGIEHDFGDRPDLDPGHLHIRARRERAYLAEFGDEIVAARALQAARAA